MHQAAQQRQQSSLPFSTESSASSTSSEAPNDTANQVQEDNYQRIQALINQNTGPAAEETKQQPRVGAMPASSLFNQLVQNAQQNKNEMSESSLQSTPAQQSQIMPRTMFTFAQGKEDNSSDNDEDEEEKRPHLVSHQQPQVQPDSLSAQFLDIDININNPQQQPQNLFPNQTTKMNQINIKPSVGQTERPPRVQPSCEDEDHDQQSCTSCSSSVIVPFSMQSQQSQSMRSQRSGQQQNNGVQIAQNDFEVNEMNDIQRQRMKDSRNHYSKNNFKSSAQVKTSGVSIQESKIMHQQKSPNDDTQQQQLNQLQIQQNSRVMSNQIEQQELQNQGSRSNNGSAPGSGNSKLSSNHSNQNQNNIIHNPDAQAQMQAAQQQWPSQYQERSANGSQNQNGGNNFYNEGISSRVVGQIGGGLSSALQHQPHTGHAGHQLSQSSGQSNSPSPKNQSRNKISFQNNGLPYQTHQSFNKNTFRNDSPQTRSANQTINVEGGQALSDAQIQAQASNQHNLRQSQIDHMSTIQQIPVAQSHDSQAHLRVRSSSNNNAQILGGGRQTIGPSISWGDDLQGNQGNNTLQPGGINSMVNIPSDPQNVDQIISSLGQPRNSINITNQNSIQKNVGIGRHQPFGMQQRDYSNLGLGGVQVQSHPNIVGAGTDQQFFTNDTTQYHYPLINAETNAINAQQQAPPNGAQDNMILINSAQNIKKSKSNKRQMNQINSSSNMFTTGNSQSNSKGISTCPYHLKPYVAFCIIHNELVCEECCDLSHHRDHNNQILLLKAAAQNFIQNVDKKLDQMVQNRMMIANCEKFNLRHSIRHTINDFFDDMRHHLDELQRKKMNEMNKILKETNFINVQLRAKELDQRADMCEQFFAKKRHEYNQKNYTKFLSKTSDIDKIVKQSDKIIRDTNFLLKESEKQRQIQLIHEKDKAKSKLKKVVDQNLKMPLVGYNKEMLDTLHFFVYNTHNLFMYNFRSHSYRSYVVNIKIPANFMSVENEEGRIFLTGGGEPGKATKSCYEFVEERLVQRRDMLFERRAHTLTSVLVEKQKSQIFAIGSSLPPESMNKCEVYDVSTDAWTQVANLNTRRNFHTTLAFDNKALYVVAGFNGGQRTNLIEKFDLKERNHWETLNLKIKENTNWICLEGCGLFQISQDHMIIFGGFTTSDQKTNHCYLFNVHTNEIEQLNCKTRTQSNFYQRQPKKGADGKLYCVETNSLDLHIFNLKSFEWDFIDRKYIGW